MVKICHSFALFAAAHALEDIEAMLQVGQFAPHGPALAQVGASRHQQALQMESNFERLAAEAVRTGQTPSLGVDALAAVNSALDTLEGELEKEKIANDAEMVGANDQCAACNKARQDAFNKKNGVDARASVVEEARMNHARCRVDLEDDSCGEEKRRCDDQDDYAVGAHAVGPKCTCEDDDTADTVKNCLQKASDWGTTYNANLGKKISHCDTAEEGAEINAKTCDKFQTDFEMAFCTYEVSLKTTCESHSKCYEDAVASRGVVVKNLKAKEASEKIMWKSCKKVRCYLDMLNATQVSQEGFNKCKQQDTDTTHLDVIYSPPPAKEDCDTTPVKTVPGNAAWLEAEYANLAPKQSWLPKRTGIEDVLPCPAPVVTPPQPQPTVTPQPIVKPQPTVDPQPIVKPVVKPFTVTLTEKDHRCSNWKLKGDWTRTRKTVATAEECGKLCKAAGNCNKFSFGIENGKRLCLFNAPQQCRSEIVQGAWGKYDIYVLGTP